MKRVIFISVIIITTTQLYGQTNRINHYSHSGAKITLSTFKSDDNMGLNCGSIGYKEYVPDSSKITFVVDSIQTDTTIKKVCKPINSTPESPRRGMSLRTTFDVQDVLNKF
jgi:hypothetical protein